MLNLKKLLSLMLLRLDLRVDYRSKAVSLPASNSVTVKVDMSKPNYEFWGVVGVHTDGTGSTLGYITSFYKSGAYEATVILRNTTSTARSYTVYVYGLYTGI